MTAIAPIIRVNVTFLSKEEGGRSYPCARYAALSAAPSSWRSNATYGHTCKRWPRGRELSCGQVLPVRLTESSSQVACMK